MKPSQIKQANQKLKDTIVRLNIEISELKKRIEEVTQNPGKRNFYPYTNEERIIQASGTWQQLQGLNERVRKWEYENNELTNMGLPGALVCGRRINKSNCRTLAVQIVGFSFCFDAVRWQKC